MRRKVIYGILAVAAVFIAKWFYQVNHPVPTTLKVASFKMLPGWETAKLGPSLRAFQASCRTLLHQEPEAQVGSAQIPMQAKDWYPACRMAMTIVPVTEVKARQFFEAWFVPLEFYKEDRMQGLFTGYYLPRLEGSSVKTDKFSVPIYGVPQNLVTINPKDFGFPLITRPLVGRVIGHKIVPFHDRKAINQGAIKDQAPVIAWTNSHIDRLFLEIQGSGIIHLTNGQTIYLGYAGENGNGYTAIGRVLIERGVLDKDKASMQSIRAYLEAHPEKIHTILNENKSFVFFKPLKHSAAMGAQGILLTPGYSLAIDRQWIPLGMPLWLDTTRPKAKEESNVVLRRLMIAQDTGGAIKGSVRGDVFWGAGHRATAIAGKMKNPGYYWLLLPRQKQVGS